MDVFVYQLKEVVPIGSITNIPATDTTPRQLKIATRLSSTVFSVEVNGLLLTSGVEQLSNSVLLVTLPTILSLAIISEVIVLADSVSVGTTARVYSSLEGGRSVTGVQYTVQQFLKWLFSRPGSDAWYPEGGGGWSAIAGLYTEGSDTPVAKLDLGLQNTLRFIQKIQATDLDLDDTERLAGCFIEKMTKTATGLSASIVLKSVAGQTFKAQVGTQ